MLNMYILDGKIPILVENLLEWGIWFGTADRRVQVSQIEGIRISTVFLGLDHGMGGPVPLLFETCIFNEKDTNIVKRYTTWEEAEVGHFETVDKVLDQLNKEKEVDKEVVALLEELNIPKL